MIKPELSSKNLKKRDIKEIPDLWIRIYGRENNVKKKNIKKVYSYCRVYKEVIDTFPDVAVGSYIIKDAQIIDEHSVHLTYYVGNGWEEKEKLIQID